MAKREATDNRAGSKSRWAKMIEQTNLPRGEDGIVLGAGAVLPLQSGRHRSRQEAPASLSSAATWRLPSLFFRVNYTGGPQPFLKFSIASLFFPIGFVFASLTLSKNFLL